MWRLCVVVPVSTLDRNNSSERVGFGTATQLHYISRWRPAENSMIKTNHLAWIILRELSNLRALLMQTQVEENSYLRLILLDSWGSFKVHMKSKIRKKFYVLVEKTFLKLEGWCWKFFNITFSSRDILCKQFEGLADETLQIDYGDDRLFESSIYLVLLIIINLQSFVSKAFKLFTKNNTFIINKVRKHNLWRHLIKYSNMNISRTKCDIEKISTPSFQFKKSLFN